MSEQNAAAMDAMESRVEAPAADLDPARVQTLRGLACLLLVSFHVVGDDATRGLEVAPDSIYRTFCDIFIHLRMPLFTFLSGFVYAYRPVTPGSGILFARKKVLRLLLPLIVVSTLYFVAQNLVPDANTRQSWADLWRIYVFPYNHFWFLQAIVLIFAVTLVFELLGWLQRLPGFLTIFAMVVVLHFYARIDLNLFSIRQATYLAPFFMAGLGANRFQAQFSSPPMKYSMLVIFAVTFGIHLLGSLHLVAQPLNQRTLLATALSLSGICTLMFWTRPAPWLAWVGGFSFTIYLYHVFFTAGARIALHHAGLHALPIHVVLGLLCGVLGPICLELALRPNQRARRLLLGQS